MCGRALAQKPPIREAACRFTEGSVTAQLAAQKRVTWALDLFPAGRPCDLAGPQSLAALSQGLLGLSVPHKSGRWRHCELLCKVGVCWVTSPARRCYCLVEENILSGDRGSDNNKRSSRGWRVSKKVQMRLWSSPALSIYQYTDKHPVHMLVFSIFF